MKENEKMLQSVMARILEVDESSINRDSNQDNLASWDSLKHLELILAIEEEFKIVFPLEEIGNLVTYQLIYLILTEQLELNVADN